MAFRDVIATDLTNVFLNEDEFAEDTIFTSAAGVTITIAAVVEPLGSNFESRPNHRLQVSRLRVSFRASDISNAGVSVSRGSFVRRGDDVFSFEAIEDDSGGMLVATFGCPKIIETGVAPEV